MRIRLLFLICLFLSLYISSCSLREKPEQNLMPVLKQTDSFRNKVKVLDEGYEAVEFPYKKIKGKSLSISELHSIYAIRRIFLNPANTVGDTLLPGMSVHLLVFTTRRKALQTYRLFCASPEWVEMQLLSKPGLVLLRYNMIIHINTEAGLSAETWQRIRELAEVSFPERNKNPEYTCHIF